VYGLDLPDPAAPRLRLFFERRTAGGPAYPSCDSVLGPITAQQGKPADVQEFDEERTRNRRFVWWHPGQRMVLLCFRGDQTRLRAAELTIESVSRPK